MSNYSKVQFLSWELCTGSPDTSLGGYPGIRSATSDQRIDVQAQCRDIDARVAFTKLAIEAAYAGAEKSSEVLKVFIAPEFLYRGAAGAYLHDLLNGWDNAPMDFQLPIDSPHAKQWSGLFGGLQELVRVSDYKDWVFVFGTAVSATFPTKLAKSGRYEGKRILDREKPAEVYNTALVQCGGVRDEGALYSDFCYATRKYALARADFLSNREVSKLLTLHTSENTKSPEGESRELGPPDTLDQKESGPVFTLDRVRDSEGKKILFGVEICYDHGRSGPDLADKIGRIRHLNSPVRLQLVPSCGVSLQEDSICLLPNSYAVNCDGYSGDGPTAGCHTHIWNSRTDLRIEGGDGKPCEYTKVIPIGNAVHIGSDNIEAASLWYEGVDGAGAGHIRIVDVLDL
jgi:hypothetical protein